MSRKCCEKQTVQLAAEAEQGMSAAQPRGVAETRSPRRKGALLFLSGHAGLLWAQLAEDAATTIWREDEESILEAALPSPTGSEVECLRPWKKTLRKGRAQSGRGGSCMGPGARQRGWRPGDVSASLPPRRPSGTQMPASRGRSSRPLWIG